MLAGVFIVPNWTFFVELILFVIVLGVVAKWILPPIQAALDERQQVVRGSMRAADEHRDEAHQLDQERGVVLEGARGEARRLLEEARSHAAELREVARAGAEAERGRRLAAAQQVLDAERPLLRVAAMQDIDRLVVDAASRVLGVPVDIARHRELIEAVVAQSSGRQAATAGREVAP